MATSSQISLSTFLNSLSKEQLQVITEQIILAQPEEVFDLSTNADDLRNNVNFVLRSNPNLIVNILGLEKVQELVTDQCGNNGDRNRTPGPEEQEKVMLNWQKTALLTVTTQGIVFTSAATGNVTTPSVSTRTTSSTSATPGKLATSRYKTWTTPCTPAATDNGLTANYLSGIAPKTPVSKANANASVPYQTVAETSSQGQRPTCGTVRQLEQLDLSNANLGAIPSASNARGSCLKEATRKGITFSGSRKDDLSLFIARVERTIECFELSERDKVRVVSELLTGDAEILVESIRHDIHTWIDLKTVLQNTYLPQQHSEDVRRQVIRMQQSADMTAAHFVAKVRVKNAQSQEPFRDPELISIITTNMHPSYGPHLARFGRKIRNWKDLTEACSQAETIMRLEDRATSVTKSERLNIQTTEVYDEVDIATLICYSCQKVGHKQAECPKTKEPYCTRCGRQGVSASQCDCSPQTLQQHTTSSGTLTEARVTALIESALKSFIQNKESQENLRFR